MVSRSRRKEGPTTVRGAPRAPRLGERHAPRRRFKKVSSYFVLTRHFAPREFTDCRAFPPRAPLGDVSPPVARVSPRFYTYARSPLWLSGKERSPLARTRRNETPFRSRRGAAVVSAGLEVLIFRRRPQSIFLGKDTHDDSTYKQALMPEGGESRRRERGASGSSSASATLVCNLVGLTEGNG